MKRERQLAISFLLSYMILAGAELEKNDRLPSADQWLGLVAAFFILSAASDLGADWAGGLGLLLLVSIALAKGDDAFAFVGSRREAAKLGRPLTIDEKTKLRAARFPAARGRIPKLRPL
jgi:hypothetical protein